MPMSISEPDVKHLAQDAGQKESNKCETARSRRVSFAVFTIAAFIIMICGSVLLFKLGGIYAEIKGELLNGCASRALFRTPCLRSLRSIASSSRRRRRIFSSSRRLRMRSFSCFSSSARRFLCSSGSGTQSTEFPASRSRKASRSIFSSVPGVRIYTSVCVIPAARSSSIRLAKDTPAPQADPCHAPQYLGEVKLTA